VRRFLGCCSRLPGPILDCRRTVGACLDGSRKNLASGRGSWAGPLISYGALSGVNYRQNCEEFFGGLILGRRFLRGSIWNVNTICIYAMRYGWGERKHRGASASMGDLVRSSGGVTGQAAHSPIQPSICASQIGESVRGSRYQNEWSAWLPSPVPKSERPFGKLRAGSGAPSAWTGDLTGTGATRRPAA